MLRIQDPEDPKTSESNAAIGAKMPKELWTKGKQPQVQLTRAHPFDVFGLLNSDEDSDTKPMSESDTSKEFVNTPDIIASDVNDYESEVPVTDLKIDLEDEDVDEKHLDGKLPTSDLECAVTAELFCKWRKWKVGQCIM